MANGGSHTKVTSPKKTSQPNRMPVARKKNAGTRKKGSNTR